MTIIDDQISKWLGNEANVANYRKGIELLEDSGLLNLLQRMGIPNFVHGGSDVNAMAAQAAYSSGFQTALENLKFFEKKYREIVAVKNEVPDFGGALAAFERGDLRKEELD